ncbi:MAG: hypothetical protein VB130_06140 [Clostridium sp.]|nr:hypothetical protein [Clostridium sp.]
MKIEFFYKCKDGRVIGKEAECKEKLDDNVDERIKNIKNYTEKLENNEYYGESVLELDE